MTTGERLVELSTLSTGTAMDHFLSVMELAGKPVVSKCSSAGVTYNVRYVENDGSYFKYIKPKTLKVRYIDSPSVKIRYVEPEQMGVIYKNPQSFKTIQVCN